MTDTAIRTYLAGIPGRRILHEPNAPAGCESFAGETILPERIAELERRIEAPLVAAGARDPRACRVKESAI
jgi:hypothetical protein